MDDERECRNNCPLNLKGANKGITDAHEVRTSNVNHWLQTSRKNLIPLSQASTFNDALSEWFFTGQVIDYDDEEIECELCEHPDLTHHFEIQNSLNKNQLLVGSSCILKFSEINIHDTFGHAITDPDERKFFLEEALREKLLELMLEPLRSLWRKDRDNQKEIATKAKQLKMGVGISPKALLFLFLRMDAFQIAYAPNRYKISLRSHDEKLELSFMSKIHLLKIKPSLSSAQLKSRADLFAHDAL